MNSLKTQHSALVPLYLLPFALALVSGCEKHNRHGIQLTEAGFPVSMVGVWSTVADEDTRLHWAIKFEEDGSVRRIEHYMAGRVDLDTGGIHFDGKDGSSFLFVFDRATTKYDNMKNTVGIKIRVPYYRMELPVGTLEGNLEDIFEGIVSADGKFWNAKWINRGELDGGAKVSDELTEKHAREIVFEKIDTSVQ